MDEGRERRERGREGEEEGFCLAVVKMEGLKSERRWMSGSEKRRIEEGRGERRRGQQKRGEKGREKRRGKRRREGERRRRGEKGRGQEKRE